MKILKLKNNLSTIFIPNKNIDYISIEYKVKAGSNYENPENIGVAHLTEHLILSKHAEMLQRYGGKVWGITSRDDALIYIKILKEYFSEAIKYLATILNEDKYNQEDLEIQKKIILHEIDRSLSNPEKILLRKSYKTLYPKTRMEKLNTGEKKDIQNISLKQIIDFKNSHYTAENSVLALTGNFLEEEILKILNENFSKLPKGKKIKNQKIQTNSEKNIQKIKGNYNQIHVKMDFNGFVLKDKNKYALSLLTFIIDNQLNKIIRQEKGLCYIINAKDFYTDSYGVFSIYTATNDLKVIKEINEVIKNIKIENIEIAKLNVISELVFSLENPSQSLDFYATNFLFDNMTTIQEEVAKYKQVTKNDIFKVLNYIVNQKNKITILE